ncbi:Transient receptor putative cation channel subfamily A member 1 [Balamuthia mandrillaris]
MANLVKLHTLAKKGSPAEMMAFIRDFGKDSLVLKDKHGQSVLHVAVDAENLDMVKFLLTQTNININTRDRNGWTPLHVACSSGNVAMVELLLGQPGCDVKRLSVDGSTPLHYLVRHNPPEHMKHQYFACIRRLVDMGCNPNLKNSNGDTALHYAASRGRENVLVFMVKELKTPCLNALNNYGETPLHLAARMGDVGMATTLLSLGVDPSIIGDNGTALDVAKAGHHDEIVLLLDGSLSSDSEGSLCASEGDEIPDTEADERQKQKLKHLIDNAKETKKLNLSNMELRTVPDQVWELSDLTELNLGFNELTTLPQSISKLSKLEVLRLDSNRLKTLPQQLGTMKHLKEVTLALNSHLSPILKRKARQSLAELLDHVAKYGDTDEELSGEHDFPPLLRKVSSGLACENFIPEDAEEDEKGAGLKQSILEGSKTHRPQYSGDNLRPLPKQYSPRDMRELALRVKEKKISDTINILQSRSEELKAKAMELEKKEELLKLREKRIKELSSKVMKQKEAGTIEKQKSLPTSSTDSNLRSKKVEYRRSLNSIDPADIFNYDKNAELTKKKEWKLGQRRRVSVQKAANDLFVCLNSNLQKPEHFKLNTKQWDTLKSLIAEIDKTLNTAE